MSKQKSILDPYRSIYRKLEKIIPNLKEELDSGPPFGKSVSAGFMNLNFDYLRKEDTGHIIALSQHFKMNGDLVPDPDMTIRVFTEQEVAEALTFQDQRSYQEVYVEQEGKHLVNVRLKKELNEFLNQWLTNLIDQNHRIDMDAARRELAQDEIEDEKNMPRNESLKKFREDNSQQRGDEIER